MSSAQNSTRVSAVRLAYEHACEQERESEQIRPTIECVSEDTGDAGDTWYRRYRDGRNARSLWQRARN